MAKQRLQSYLFHVKTTIDDENLADRISADDMRLIADAIEWLDTNQLAGMEEFSEKQREVEAVWNPIITELYESAGGAPGARIRVWPNIGLSQD